MEPVVVAIVVGVLIFLVFLGVWLLDARRAEKVEHDPERLDVDTTSTESASSPRASSRRLRWGRAGR